MATKSLLPKGTSSETYCGINSCKAGSLSRACFRALQYAQVSDVPNTISGRLPSLARAVAASNRALGGAGGSITAGTFPDAFSSLLVDFFVVRFDCAGAAVERTRRATIARTL